MGRSAGAEDMAKQYDGDDVLLRGRCSRVRKDVGPSNVLGLGISYHEHGRRIVARSNGREGPDARENSPDMHSSTGNWPGAGNDSRGRRCRERPIRRRDCGQVRRWWKGGLKRWRFASDGGGRRGGDAEPQVPAAGF
jgi:hypothetical protein